jgi:beta-N-acetylglucosaminidase
MNTRIRKEGILNIVGLALGSLLLIVFVFSAVTLTLNIKEDHNNITKLQNDIEQTKQSQKELNEKIQTVADQQVKLNQITQELLTKEEKRALSISNLQSRGFNRYTDISANRDLTPEDMDKIINTWDKHVKGGTAFKGHGAAFIAASKKSGLNPIIILAHAATESKWGNSEIAREKNNYFGINCVDSNPDAGFNMGNDLDSGIIAGAMWIKKNFYNNGYESLQAMTNGNYASDQNWANEILKIANASVRILES